MALTFSSFFAVGVLLISLLKNNVDLDSFLFGDILGVRLTDVYRTSIVTIGILGLVWLFYKELFVLYFRSHWCSCDGIAGECHSSGVYGSGDADDYREYEGGRSNFSNCIDGWPCFDGIFIGEGVTSDDAGGGNYRIDREYRWGVY